MTREEARNTITHIVVISQENRTYDDIFGGFAGGPAAYPGGDGTVPSSIAPDVKPAGFDTDPPHNAHDWYRCLQVNRFTKRTWDDFKTRRMAPVADSMSDGRTAI